MNQLKVDRNS